MDTPETVRVQLAGAGGELMGCMRREIKTPFDYDNAPFSNMVPGEVLNFPGKWSSYPPHHYPQPEGDPRKKTRIDDPEHAWPWKPDADEHIF